MYVGMYMCVCKRWSERERERKRERARVRVRVRVRVRERERHGTLPIQRGGGGGQTCGVGGSSPIQSPSFTLEKRQTKTVGQTDRQIGR